MGTTESTLESSYDDDDGDEEEEDDDSHPSPDPYLSPRNEKSVSSSVESHAVRNKTASPRQLRATVDRNQNRSITLSASSDQSQQQQQQPRQQQQPQKEQLKINSRGDSNQFKRHRAPPNQSLQLQGVILGLAKTGKRTLLQRFQGIDPYDINSQSDHENQTNNHETITIPYQTNRTAWDERIQLQMRVAPKLALSSTGDATDSIDFFIILVDPRHSAATVQSYLTAILDSIVQMKGYRRISSTANQNGHEPATEKPLRPPICICVLRNFRDVEPRSSATTTPAHDQNLVSKQDLEQWMEGVLHDFPSLTSDRRVAQVEMASLRNCYGLNALHHFIYRSYVQRKQWDTEQYLWEIRQQVQVATNDVPAITYEAFLKIVSQATSTAANDHAPPTTPNGQLPQQPHTSQQQQHQRRNHYSNKGQQSDPTSPTSATSPHAPKSSSPRRVVPRTAREAIQITPRTKVVNTPLTLEAFLESEDEDDNNNQVGNSWESEDDDDDDDDSFFYDDTGKRQGSTSPPSLKKTTYLQPMNMPASKPMSISLPPPSASLTMFPNQPKSSSDALPPTRQPSNSSTITNKQQSIQNDSGVKPKSPGRLGSEQHNGKPGVASSVKNISVTLKDTDGEILEEPTTSISEIDRVSGPSILQSNNIQHDTGEGKATIDYTINKATKENTEPVVAKVDAGELVHSTSGAGGHPLKVDDIANSISRLAVQDGWDDDDYDDENDGMVENRDATAHLNALRPELGNRTEDDDDDDDAYVIGEDKSIIAGPAKVASPVSVEQDEGDFIIEKQSRADSRLDKNNLDAPLENKLEPEIAVQESKATTLSLAAMDAIAEAQRNAERMLLEKDPQVLDEKREKKLKKKKKDSSKDPVKKKKKDKKRRDSQTTDADDEDDNY